MRLTNNAPSPYNGASNDVLECVQRKLVGYFTLYLCVCVSVCEVIVSLFVRWFYVCLSVGLNSPKKINCIFVRVNRFAEYVFVYLFLFVCLSHSSVYIYIYIFSSMVLCANTQITYSHSHSHLLHTHIVHSITKTDFSFYTHIITKQQPTELFVRFEHESVQLSFHQIQPGFRFVSFECGNCIQFRESFDDFN